MQGSELVLTLFPRTALVVGSGCVCILMMQCFEGGDAVLFVGGRRSHGDDVVCCENLTGAYLKSGQIRLTCYSNYSRDCRIVCVCMLYLLLSKGDWLGGGVIGRWIAGGWLSKFLTEFTIGDV